MSILNDNTGIPKPTLPGANQHLEGDTRIAAFFDLDKTILATASAMALSTPLVQAGLVEIEKCGDVAIFCECLAIFPRKRRFWGIDVFVESGHHRHLQLVWMQHCYPQNWDYS